MRGTIPIYNVLFWKQQTCRRRRYVFLLSRCNVVRKPCLGKLFSKIAAFHLPNSQFLRRLAERPTVHDIFLFRRRDSSGRWNGELGPNSKAVTSFVGGAIFGADQAATSQERTLWVNMRKSCIPARHVQEEPPVFEVSSFETNRRRSCIASPFKLLSRPGVNLQTRIRLQNHDPKDDSTSLKHRAEVAAGDAQLSPPYSLLFPAMSDQPPDGSGLLGGDSSNGSANDSGTFSTDSNAWWWSSSAVSRLLSQHVSGVLVLAWAAWERSLCIRH
jgi:hypothetical protein